MIDIFKKDYLRYKHKNWKPYNYFTFWKSRVLLFTYFGRKESISNNRPAKKIWSILFKHFGQKMGIEMEFRNIGSGLLLAHPYAITVNGGAKLGENVTLFKGCTIGSIRGGAKGGVSTIGDRVTICSNATVCGNIVIGDDVLIAAGAFVNFDVPSNSIVLGNPGVIHHKENPSAYYF